PDIHAIRVYDSVNMEISRNRISSELVGHASSANSGILVDTSTYCIIRENRIQPFLGIGIYLESSGYCDVIDNLCNRSSFGYYIRASSNCYLEKNRAIHTGMGFGIWVGQDHTLIGNRAEKLSDDGFIIANSYDCQLIGNIARDISDYRSGIELIYGAANNILYGNFILCSNVHDNGSNNAWDNGVNLGNYWSSYNGTGIYPIPGTAGSVDRFPQHFIDPAINLESSCDFEYGFENRFLNWTYSGQAPLSYTLERLNESQMYQTEIEGLWNGSQTTLSLYLEPTEVGEYIYRFTVLYTGGFSLIEEMVVHIVPASGPHIESVLPTSEYLMPEYDIVVAAIVNDISGVSKVIFSYNTSIDGLWRNITMDWNGTDFWTVMFPGQPNNTILYLKVYANDTLGNSAVTGVIKKLVTDSPPTSPTIPHTTPNQEGSFITVLLIGGILVEISIIAYIILDRRHK
ncbi:MAG: nitrous oxide reductase family maturation protein NosD, partial [Candidatus Thorarchaeota archaeon]